MEPSVKPVKKKGELPREKGKNQKGKPGNCTRNPTNNFQKGEISSHGGDFGTQERKSIKGENPLK